MTASGHLDGASPRPPLRLRGAVLPDEDERDVWVTADGTISLDPLDDAHSVTTGGWITPALVDAHVHIGVSEVGGPLDHSQLDADLTALARSGIGAIRVPGSPERLPHDALGSPGRPLVQTAGVPVAGIDRFIPGWGRRVPEGGLAAACAEEAAACGWTKIIADWFDDEGRYVPSFSPEAIASAVSAAHAAGGRVAVHTQSQSAGDAAARAGADSIEHGMHLTSTGLNALAAHDRPLVPTGHVFDVLAPTMLDTAQPEPMRDWYADGLRKHPDLVRAAMRRSVPVLAGTDLPVGSLVDEVHWLHHAGMSAHAALGAATWTARAVLGLPRLRHGDRADLLWFDTDPRDDLEALRSPGIVIVGGVHIPPA